MNVILTSDFPSTPSANVAAAMRQNGDDPRIAWIPGRTERGSVFADAQDQFRALGFTALECLDIDEECDPVQLAYLHEFDVVFLSAGDAVRFRYNAIRSGLAGRLRQYVASGGLTVGAGGGSLLLTPNISLARLEQETPDQVLTARGRFDALAAVPYEVMPHANRCDAALLDKVREYSSRVDFDVIVMADGGALFHLDGRPATHEGTITHFRKGNIIEP